MVNLPGIVRSMLVRVTVLLLLSAANLVADPKRGDEGTPEHAKAAALVKQLGDQRFATREAAAKQLLEMGAPALPALEAGAKSTDEEVSKRSVALLPQIKAIVRQQRAEAYGADIDGKEKHELPLLAEWEKVTGKPDASSRKLFAAMVRADADLLEQVATDPKAAADAIQSRCRALVGEIQTGHDQKRVEPDRLALLFFANLRAPGRTATFGRADHPCHLLNNPGVAEGVRAKDIGPAFRRLLTAWIEAQDTDEVAADQYFAFAVHATPFPEAVPALARMARNPKAPSHHVRAVAIEALGRIGDDRAKAMLADLTGNPAVLIRGSRGECRAGDLALANWLVASGKRPEDYGMSKSSEFRLRVAQRGPVVSLAVRWFPDGETRDRALEKWKTETAKKDR